MRAATLVDSSMVAVLAVLCVSDLLCPEQNQLRHDMIRSRFQYSFVMQSVLQSYLVGFVLLYICSALQLQSSSTMLLQCLCTKSEMCTCTGYELDELLY